MQASIQALFLDRIRGNAVLVVLCFVSVLLLGSQSAASYPSYFLALSMLVSIRHWADVFRDWFIWLLLLLVTYLALSTLWSTPFSWRELTSYLVKSILIFSFVAAFAECQLRGEVQLWLGRALGVSGAIASALAIVVFWYTDPADGRLNGLGQLDTHVVAALVFSSTLIYVLDSLGRTTSPGWLVFSAVAICCIVISVILSDSRNAQVSLILGFGVFFLSTKIRNVRDFVLSIVVLALLGAVILFAVTQNLDARELVFPRGDSFRLGIWQFYFENSVMAHPWIGAGIATVDDIHIGGHLFLHPHNMYLSVLVQSGLVGLLAFFALTAVTITTLLKNYDRADAKVALGILAISLSSYLLDGHELLDKVGETWFLYWLPVAIAAGLRWQRSLQLN